MTTNSSKKKLAEITHVRDLNKLLTEEMIQRQIIDGLERFGYTVHQTTVRKKLASCPKCHSLFRPSGGYGASYGVPDLLVRRPSWPRGLSLGLEVKRPAGKFSSIGQQEAYHAGCFYVVYGFDDALRFLVEFENKLVLD